MAGLLTSEAAPTGATRLSDWLGRERRRAGETVRVRAGAQLPGVGRWYGLPEERRKNRWASARPNERPARPPPPDDGRGLSEEGLLGRVLAGPAAMAAQRQPEVDGGGGAADLQVLPQRFGCRGEPAPDRLGRLALSGLQLPRLSRALCAGCTRRTPEAAPRGWPVTAARTRFAYRNSAKRGHPVYLLIQRLPRAAARSYRRRG